MISGGEKKAAHIVSLFGTIAQHTESTPWAQTAYLQHTLKASKVMRSSG